MSKVICSCGGGENDGHNWNCPWQAEAITPASVEEIKRPNVKDYFNNLADAHAEYSHSTNLFGYVLNLDLYADKLESQLTAKEAENRELKECVINLQQADETPAGEQIQDSMMLKGGNTPEEKIEWLLQRIKALEEGLRNILDYYDTKGSDETSHPFDIVEKLLNQK